MSFADAGIRIQLRDAPRSEEKLELTYQAVRAAVQKCGEKRHFDVGNIETFHADNDERIEIPIALTDFDGLETDGLIYFCQDFEKLLLRELAKIGDTKTCVTIGLFNNSIFPHRFDLSHVLSLEKIRFGNLINAREFLPHFEKDPPDTKSEWILHKFLPKVRATTTLVAQFYHDSKFFSIYFPHYQTYMADNVRRSEFTAYSLTFRYNSFRRIVVHVDDGGRAQMYFQVRHPPRITGTPLVKNIAGRYKIRRPVRMLSWGDESINQAIGESACIQLSVVNVNNIQFVDLLGRLVKQSNVPIEYHQVVNLPLFPCSNYLPFITPEFSEKHNLDTPERFDLLYTLHALISRNCVIKDRLLIDADERDAFLEVVLASYNERPEETIDFLEQLICAVDEAKFIHHPYHLFVNIKRAGTVTVSLQRQRRQEWVVQGYMRMRKVIITPTRMLFTTPEFMMGNRFIRKHGIDGMLRIVFRDDNGSKISVMTGAELIDKCVHKPLVDGIVIAGHKYVMVGSSNSQLRDNGCYFVRGTVEDAVAMRRDMGRFKVEPVAKMMSRIGQCFTQSRLSHLRIARNAYEVRPDFIGGCNARGEPYCFSDGCGCYSMKFAEHIAKDMNFGQSVPSCVQFRFRGFKGVLSLNPALDQYADWLKNNDFDEEVKEPIDMVLRPSQEKFRAPREERIEIVKQSAPSPVALNRPLINILDQVSRKQSPDCHQRICRRVEHLAERAISSFMSVMHNEQQALHAMATFPRFIMYERLSEFAMTQEPFFMSMLRAYVRSQLNKLIRKMRIPIPTDLGRTMFGVVDETGLLQCGEVFVQYTLDVNDKHPGPTACRRILEGDVMVTKNPNIVSGDVRLFKAVNHPALRHLCDVIVFPQWGPRPHPDEMAGSDLDGDEYSVIWDEQLYFDYNEEPFDFAAASLTTSDSTIMNDGPEFQRAMVDFFEKYIAQDSIGQISHAHLGNADLYGIDSQVCLEIVKKHSQSVDFPKTGVAPEMLTRKRDPPLPPEIVQYWPDFMNKRHSPKYRSQSLLGGIYRSIEQVEVTLESAEHLFNKQSDFDFDKSFMVDTEPYEKEYFKFVSEEYSNYASQIQCLLETYGIESEGDLFSGYFNATRGRTSDTGDNDDLSLFNVATIVIHRLEEAFGLFRGRFFAKFPDAVLEPIQRRGYLQHGSLAINGHVCERPSPTMIAVACMYYQLAYTTGAMLSFPWLIWDVLVSRRHEYVIENRIQLPIDPFGEHLATQMVETLECSHPALADRVAEIQEAIESAETQTMEYVRGYCEKYVGMREILTYGVLWADRHKLKIKMPELFVFIIAFASGQIVPNVEGYVSWLEPVSLLSDAESIDLNERTGGIGRRFIFLLSYLACNELLRQDNSFFQFGESFIYPSSQNLVALHEAAFKTYFQLSMTSVRTVLPGPLTDENAPEPPVAIVEGLPCIVEVQFMALDTCIANLRARSIDFGLHHVAIRAHDQIKDGFVRVSVVAVGELHAIRAFYDTLTPIPAEDIDEPLEKFDAMIRDVSARLANMPLY
uniref:RNA-directed RNA polymerase n=1 Tax=Panagrellus redivivus TaxID=6233 RepID=A0A7E4UZV9_PANRE